MTPDEKDAMPAGLTDAEVADRVARGNANTDVDVKTRSVRQIVAGARAHAVQRRERRISAVLVLLTGSVHATCCS